jgi:Zn-dependent peptidase ImmA (M78 family)
MKSYVNPKIISWARKRARLTIEDLASKMKRDPIEIEKWESGKDDPSYTTLEQMAYRYFKIPLAVFFFPEPPDIEEPEKKFRRLPTFELERFSADTYQKIRLAQAYQDSLGQLMEDITKPQKVFHDISYRNIEVSKLAEKTRIYLGISLDEQYRFQSCESAFRGWRHVIEDAGIFTFKDSFKDRFISGFSLLDEEYPIIFINNSNTFSRQVFTLIHELGHIIHGVSGVTDIDQSYLNMMNNRERSLEIKCNQFAGHFLVPDDAFVEDIRYFRAAGESAISEIADKYSVSREVILRRLLEHGEVTNEYYEQKSAEWNKDYLSREKSTSGGNYYLTRLSYLGEGFTKLAFDNYYRGRLSRPELGRHLNMNSRNLQKLETYTRW